MSVRFFSLVKWNRRRVLIGLSVLAIGVVAGREVVIGYRQAAALNAAPTSTSFGSDLHGWKAKPEYSDKLNNYEAWLKNDLIKQRTPWTMEQVQRLLDQFDHPPDAKYYADLDQRMANNDSTLTLRDLERDMFFDDAVGAVEERFRRDEPMDSDARAALQTRFVELMQSPRSRLRDKFTASVQYARMPRDPAVRAAMISLFGDNAMEDFDKKEQLYAKGMLVK